MSGRRDSNADATVGTETGKAASRPAIDIYGEVAFSNPLLCRPIRS